MKIKGRKEISVEDSESAFQMLAYLVEQPLSVFELSKVVGVHHALVSRQVKKLKKANWIFAKRINKKETKFLINYEKILGQITLQNPSAPKISKTNRIAKAMLKTLFLNLHSLFESEELNFVPALCSLDFISLTSLNALIRIGFLPFQLTYKKILSSLPKSKEAREVQNYFEFKSKNYEIGGLILDFKKILQEID